MRTVFAEMQAEALRTNAMLRLRAGLAIAELDDPSHAAHRARQERLHDWLARLENLDAEALSPADRGAFVAEVDGVVRKEIYAAFAGLRGILVSELSRRAREDDRAGLAWVPGGRAVYEAPIEYHTTPPRHLPAAEDGIAAPETLRDAKKPPLMAGTEVKWSCAGSQLHAFIDEARLSSFVNGMGRGQIPHDSPQLLNRVRRDALNETDVFVLAGSVLDFRMRYGRAVNADAKPEGPKPPRAPVEQEAKPMAVRRDP